jgi:DNA-binding NtrC family response regulator
MRTQLWELEQKQKALNLVAELDFRPMDPQKVTKSFNEVWNILSELYLIKNMSDTKFPLKQFLLEFEKKIIGGALILAEGNQRKAANFLGLKVTTINEKIKKYQLTKVDVKTGFFY